MKNKKFPLSLRTMALAIAAVLFLSIGTVGTTRAALSTSGKVSGDVVLSSLEVGLSENGVAIPDGGTLLTNLLPEGEKMKLGMKYDEVLAATGSDEYARVIITKYWADKDGNKVSTVDPALIKLELADGADVISETEEQTIVYVGMLDGSAPVTKTISVDPAAAYVEKTDTSYAYTLNEYHICLEVEVDAVQSHNSADAQLSAWGESY